MVTMNEYKNIVRDLILEIGEIDRSAIDWQTAIITDDEHGHYLLMKIGWLQNKRLYGPYLHVQVQDGKVLVHQNGTDIHIGHELNQRGIKKEDIVLAFQMPLKREYSGFAVS